MANIYTQIQFPAKLDSRMCSRHEYPRLEMRLFKFPLAPSLSAGASGVPGFKDASQELGTRK